MVSVGVAPLKVMEAPPERLKDPVAPGVITRPAVAPVAVIGALTLTLFAATSDKVLLDDQLTGASILTLPEVPLAPDEL